MSNKNIPTLLFVTVILGFGVISQLLTRSNLPVFDLMFRALGSAAIIGIFALIPSFITRWILKLANVIVPPGKFPFLLSSWAMLIGSLSLAGQQFNKSFDSRALPTSADRYFFMPPGCEYSVTFAAKPIISESNASLFDRRTDGKLAMLQMPGRKGFTRAECYTVPPDVISRVDKEHAYNGMKILADSAGVKDFQLAFREGPSGKVCEMRGTKLISDHKGNKANLSLNWRTYYGTKSLLSVMIVGAAGAFPSTEQIAFRDSVKRIRP